MPVSQLPQAPYRQDRRSFPTPLTTDVLFSEVRDCNRTAFPEYGTPHPNATKWPYHKLIFIKTVDIERSDIFEFFYAADRENQDLYNFAAGYRNVIGNVGGREFRVVLREYLTPRADFDPLFPAFGTAMPNVPENIFDDIEYVFLDKQQQKTAQPELDSLYVAEVRTYIETSFLEEKLSFSVETPIVTPEKFRAGLPTVVTEEIVGGKVSLPTPAKGQISISEDQINPDIKRVRTVSRSDPSGSLTLSGTRTYVEQTTATTTETYSQSEIDAETGLLVVQSQVTPLGDGSYIRESVKVNSWPTIVSSDWDNNVNAQVVRTQQFVDPPTGSDFSLPDTSFTPVTEDRFLRVTETVPYEQMAEYLVSYSSVVDLSLPNVLTSIVAVWSEDQSDGKYESRWNGEAEGENISISGSERGEATGSASKSPSLLVNIEQPWGQDCPINIHIFYVRPSNVYSNSFNVSGDLVRGRLSQVYSGIVKEWPFFKPQSHRIVTTAKRVTVAAQCNGSFSFAKSEDNSQQDATSGSGDTTTVDTTKDVVNIPPTLHKEIIISGGTSREVSANANCRVELPFGGSASSNVGTGNSIAEIHPPRLAATTPADIPRSGYYLLRYTAEPYKWGWHRVTASVVDAGRFI